MPIPGYGDFLAFSGCFFADFYGNLMRGILIAAKIRIQAVTMVVGPVIREAVQLVDIGLIRGIFSAINRGRIK